MNKESKNVELFTNHYTDVHKMYIDAHKSFLKKYQLCVQSVAFKIVLGTFSHI